MQHATATAAEAEPQQPALQRPVCLLTCRLLCFSQVQQMRQLWEKVRAMRADTQAQLATATQVLCRFIPQRTTLGYRMLCI